MKCPRCGMIWGSQPYRSQVCDDCTRFSEILLEVWQDIDEKVKSGMSLDSTGEPGFRLLADMNFLTTRNPQLRIYYNVCEVMVAQSLNGNIEMTDEDLYRKVRTIRGFSDIFEILIELNIIELDNRPLNKVIKFRPLLASVGTLHESIEVEKQTVKRVAAVFAGYVLLFVLSKVACISNENQLGDLPYNQRPLSLWVALMYLWIKGYRRETNFNGEDFQHFVSKRGITSGQAHRMLGGLRATDPIASQTLIEDATGGVDSGTFRFNDYFMRYMERIRRRVRQRERT